VVDSRGNIIDDLWAKIVKIEIDNIDFTNKLNVISTYTDNQGNPTKTFGFLGYSTEYTLNMLTPGFYFLRNLDGIVKEEFESWYNQYLEENLFNTEYYHKQ